MNRPSSLHESVERLRQMLQQRRTELVRMTLSERTEPDDPATKVTVHPVVIQGEHRWQWSWQEGRQQRHENLTWEQTVNQVLVLLEAKYRQALMLTLSDELHVRSGKPSGWKIRQRPVEEHSDAPTATTPGHNRQKAYLIAEGSPCAFLQAIGVMTEHGKVKASQYHKFRQINRFLEMIDDVAEHLVRPDGEVLHVVDYGSGKSYLTFAMQHYFAVKGIAATLTAIDVRADVVATCQRVAGQLGINNIDFQIGQINAYQKPGPIDLAVALHACDTATDDALLLASSRGARVILAVPCCQHELRPKLSQDLLGPMFKHGILKEQFASLLTDTFRALALERDGYAVQILEFIDLEHTHKNLLLRAVRRETPRETLRERSVEQMEQLIRFFGVQEASCLLRDGKTG